jgi:hypothetical protein
MVQFERAQSTLAAGKAARAAPSYAVGRETDAEPAFAVANIKPEQTGRDRQWSPGEWPAFYN